MLRVRSPLAHASSPHPAPRPTSSHAYGGAWSPVIDLDPTIREVAGSGLAAATMPARGVVAVAVLQAVLAAGGLQAVLAAAPAQRPPSSCAAAAGRPWTVAGEAAAATSCF